MCDLNEAIQRLTLFLRQRCDAPQWNQVLLLMEEPSQCGGDAARRISLTALQSATAFQTHFEALLASGPAWINLHAAGIHEEALVVIVEMPSTRLDCPRDRIAINYSGPAGNEWNLAGRIAKD